MTVMEMGVCTGRRERLKAPKLCALLSGDEMVLCLRFVERQERIVGELWSLDRGAILKGNLSENGQKTRIHVIFEKSH